jgi:hypothetical protein
MTQYYTQKPKPTGKTPNKSVVKRPIVTEWTPPTTENGNLYLTNIVLRKVESAGKLLGQIGWKLRVVSINSVPVENLAPPVPGTVSVAVRNGIVIEIQGVTEPPVVEEVPLPDGK